MEEEGSQIVAFRHTLQKLCSFYAASSRDMQEKQANNRQRCSRNDWTQGRYLMTSEGRAA